MGFLFLAAERGGRKAHIVVKKRSFDMRASGILMHITSLPGPYGIGTMGKNAYEFVDFLKKSGQKIWQILPLSPTGFGNSPYQSGSAFAGNHYLIDLETLIDEGLLKKQEAESFFWGENEEKADFGALYENRSKVLRLLWCSSERSCGRTCCRYIYKPGRGLHRSCPEPCPGLQCPLSVFRSCAACCSAR